MKADGFLLSSHENHWILVKIKDSHDNSIKLARASDRETAGLQQRKAQLGTQCAGSDGATARLIELQESDPPKVSATCFCFFVADASYVRGARRERPMCKEPRAIAVQFFRHSLAVS